MATNKHAQIRYQALDKCFSNKYRKFFMEDLIEACNKALYNFTGSQVKIKKRQIFDDIKYMESPEGYDIVLDRLKEGKKTYYRYADDCFSINKKTLSDKEQKQLRTALLTLSRLKGLPQFEWMEETIMRLNSELDLGQNNENFVFFDQNQFLTGLEFISNLYEAINNRQVLEIQYLSFKTKEPITYIFHPYILKQYNNRWFCFGLNSAIGKISNLALDRIQAIKTTELKYIPNENVDFSEYFEDIIGVTVLEEKPCEIILNIDNTSYPYIKTKPLHGSTKIIESNEKFTKIKLQLIPNNEFESLLLSFGEKIQLIQPMELREKIRERVKKLAKLYK